MPCAAEPPSRAPQSAPRRSLGTVGLGALILGFPWYALMALIFAPRPAAPLWIAMLAGTGWAVIAYAIVSRWASGEGWSDRHRCALVFGAMLVSMLAGFLGSGTWPAIDVVGKIVLNVIAIALIVWLGAHLHRGRGPTAVRSG
jgi:hypothetical protein